MPHKKPTAIFLFLLLAAVWALSPASEVKASSFFDCTDFSIEFTGVVSGPGGKFTYPYDVTGGAKAINKLSLLEFVLDPNLSYEVVSPAGADPTVPANLTPLVCVAGAGGSGSDPKHAIDVPQVCVATVTSFVDQTGLPLELVVTGNGGQVDDIGGHTQAGRSDDTCQGLGPSRGLPLFISVLAFKRIEINGIEYCIPIEANGCPDPGLTQIDPCDLTQIPLPASLPVDENFVIGSSDEVGEEAPDVLQINQGTGADPNCALSQIGHNPCTWVTIGGRAYGPICF